MSQDPSSFSAEDLNNPNIDARTLQQLAADRSDLWPNILAHPNCYPALAEYINTHMQPPEPPQSPAGEQAQGAPAEPAQGAPAQQAPGAGEHFAAGARRAADDAKDYWSNTAAPAFSGASKNAQKTVKANKASWKFWVRLGQPILAFLAFIILFTPAARVLDRYDFEGQAENLAEQLGISNELAEARDQLGLHTTQNFLTHDMTGAGVVLLLLLLATIGVAVASIVSTRDVLRIVAAATGGLAGLYAAILAIVYLVVAAEDYLTVGVGAVLMLIVSMVLMAASVIVALPQPRRAATN